MPFNPDEYLAKKQTETATPSAGAPQAFDPNSYLNAKGVNTLPNGGQIQDGSTAANAMQTYQDFAPVAGQGAALGYGKQLNAGIQTAAGALDQVVNGSNNFGDQSASDASVFQRIKDAFFNAPENYKRAKQGVSEQIQKTRDAHPVASALTEIAASIPATTAIGTQLPSLSTIGKAATIGAGYGYGASNNTGLSRLEDAGTAGAISAATAGAFQLGGKAINAVKGADYAKYLESEYGDYSKPVKAVQDMTAKTSADGTYTLSMKSGVKDAFKLGQEMGSALTNPDTQLQITKELNSQPEVVKTLINNTRSALGEKWGTTLKNVGASPADAQGAFKNAYEKIQSLFTEGNEPAARLKDALLNQVKTIEDSLVAKSPSGTLKDVPLSALADAQETLGQIIYKQKAFQSISNVHGAAKSIFGGIAKAFNAADETSGSGGELSNINKVFSALYNMEDNSISGATIKSLTDPQATGAQQKWADFVKPFQDLSPANRDVLAPEIHHYLANEFPKTLAKAKTMLLVTERGGASGANNKALLSLSALRNFTKSGLANIANKAGAASTSEFANGTTGSLGILRDKVQQGLPSVAPALGAMSSEPLQRSLKEMP
jgi:hypothetical protein